MDSGIETITDADEKAVLGRQARGIHPRSIAVALVVTAALYLVP